jgi:autotransporter-associated beta strand protein
MRRCVSAIALLVCLSAWVDSAWAASCRWTGAAPGNDNRWSTDANWICGGGHTHPLDGDDLSFSNGAAKPVNVDDLINADDPAAGLTLTQISIAGRGAAPGLAHWDITAIPGARITLTDDVFANSPIDPDGQGPSFLVPLTLAGNTILIDNGNDDTAARLLLGNLDLNGHHVQFDDHAPISMVGTVSGSGDVAGFAVLLSGRSMLTLNDNTYTGGTRISGGGTIVAARAHALGASGPENVVDVRNGTLILSDGVVIDQPVTLELGAVFVPPGASATLAGPVSVISSTGGLAPLGTLTITGLVSTAPGMTLTVAGGGTLILSNPLNTWSSLDLKEGTVRASAAGAIPATAAVTLSDGLETAILDLNNLDVTVGALNGTAGGRVLLGSRTLTVNVPVTSLSTYNGTIAGTGHLVKAGGGEWFMRGAGANTYTGTTTVQAGFLHLAKTSTNATILGPVVINDAELDIDLGDQIADDVAVTVNQSGALALNSAAAVTDTIGALTGNGGDVSLAKGRLSIGTNNTSTTFGGAIIADPPPDGLPPEAYVRLVKIGTGTLTLTKNSNLTTRGVIDVDAGTLIINAQFTAGDVVVKPGATLGGTAAVNGDDGVGGRLTSTGGAISPGTGPGTLHAMAAQIADVGSLVMQLNGPSPGVSYDQLDLAGDLTLAAGAQLVATRGFSPLAGTTFTIVNLAAGKTVTGTFAGLPEGGTLMLDGQTFRITYHGGDGNDIVLRAIDGPTEITYYLSEGATGGFFDEDVLIANPTATAAPVTLTFSKEDGTQVIATRTVPAQARLTVHVDQIAGLDATAASAQVRSDDGVPLIVERSMFWDASYYAGHTGSAVDQPQPDWLFAEGSQGFFDTFVLVINPNATATDVTFTFFRESEDPVVKTVTVGATTRLTLHAGDVPDLVDRSFGIAIHATQPIMAERSMYFGTTPSRLWSGGHESAGVTAASTHWFLAEGATGGFFDTFILLSNPQDQAAAVDLQYLLDTGETVHVAKSVPSHTRLTVNIEAEDDVRLKNAAVSTVIRSDVPIIAERSMYWPGAAVPWGEGHNSFGVVDASTHWGLAEGRTGGPLKYHTYILLANPQSTDANVTVTYLREGGTPVTQTYTVAKTSRFNIDTNAIDGLQEASFGALIEVTNNVPIVVERSMYWDSNGFQFSGGTNATGILLPDAITSGASVACPGSRCR